MADSLTTHPIDAEIRLWLKRHVDNKAELSVAVGHSGSWLHKFVNGAGHATIDDLVRLAGTLLGLNLPALSEIERKLLKACQSMDDEADVRDVLAYAEHRARLARRDGLRRSAGPRPRTPPATTHTGRGKRRDATAAETTGSVTTASGHPRK